MALRAPEIPLLNAHDFRAHSLAIDVLSHEKDIGILSKKIWCGRDKFEEKAARSRFLFVDGMGSGRGDSDSPGRGY